MANVINKIMNMFNLSSTDDGYDPEDGYDVIDEPIEGEEEPMKGLFGRKTKENVDRQVKMVIMEPVNFDAAPEICDLLRENQLF